MAERQCLENELEHHASGEAAKGSLQEALEGLLVTERLVAKVRDPQTYQAVDEAYTRPRTRVGGLPRDEARPWGDSPVSESDG